MTEHRNKPISQRIDELHHRFSGEPPAGLPLETSPPPRPWLSDLLDVVEDLAETVKLTAALVTVDNGRLTQLDRDFAVICAKLTDDTLAHGLAPEQLNAKFIEVIKRRVQFREVEL